MIVVAVLVAMYAGWATLRFLLRPARFQFPEPSILLIVVAGFAVLTLYLTLGWTMTGRTYGDHLMGLRVVDRAGSTLHLPRALLRALLCALFPIGLSGPPSAPATSPSRTYWSEPPSPMTGTSIRRGRTGPSVAIAKEGDGERDHERRQIAIARGLAIGAARSSGHGVATTSTSTARTGSASTTTTNCDRKRQRRKATRSGRRHAETAEN